MQKRVFILFLLIALALAGCQQSAPDQTASPAAVVVTSDMGAVAAAPTSTAAPTTQAAAVTGEAPVAQQQAGCTVDDPRPTPGPTEEYLFPPVTEADWVLGKSDARVTILEYSDFQ